MLPIGTYQAIAVGAVLAEAGNGNPQVAVCLEIAAGDCKGQQITWYGSFSKNKGEGKLTPFERTIESLRTCGWQGDDLSDYSSIGGAEVSIVLEQDEYQGEKQTKVKWINRKGGIAVKSPMSADKAKAFAAKMRGEVVAASRATAPAPTTSVPAHRPDDDIPF